MFRTFVCRAGSIDMKYLTATLFQLLGTAALAHAAHVSADTGTAAAIVDEPFIREYALGVQRLPLDGGRIYGWEMNDRVTFGRFKGETDEFGFSVRLNAREHVEITTDGFRWRRSLGGSR